MSAPWDIIIEYLFRFVAYVFFGLVLEMVFAVDGIDRAMGKPVPRRVPKKYLEGFVSLYMIPLHGLGLLFFFEPVHDIIADWVLPARFCVWALVFTTGEIVWGWVLDKTLGFYSWDYYARSKYKVFKRGYTLWTLVPLWGVAGLIVEQYSGLVRYLSPHVVDYFGR